MTVPFSWDHGVASSGRTIRRTASLICDVVEPSWCVHSAMRVTMSAFARKPWLQRNIVCTIKYEGGYLNGRDEVMSLDRELWS
jgi:hypothetical protein